MVIFRHLVASLIVLTMAALSSDYISACYGEEMLSQERAVSSVIHSVCDLSHEFAFYTDGRFYKQYLSGSGNKDSRNWGTLHKCDLSNINLLVLMSGATPCPYIGHAMERDMFPWFQQRGLTVSAENATIENWRD